MPKPISVSDDQDLAPETEKKKVQKPEKETRQILDQVEDVQVFESFIKDSIESYITMRQLPEPYYNWKSLTDKWTEYDRCYEVRAKAQGERNKHEYDGFSNIVLPDFHEKIETVKTRFMNAIFAGGQMYSTSPTKLSKEEDAIVGKRLVDYNFKVVDFRTEVNKLLHDFEIYSTCVAYVPYTEEDVKHKVVSDLLLTPDGFPVEVNGIQQKTEPYEAYEITVKKFTDLQHIDLKEIYINPQVELIENQEVIAISILKSYNELLKWEEDEVILPGMADYVKDFYNNMTSSLDSDLDKERQEKGQDESLRERKVASFQLYWVFFKHGEGAERQIYEGIYLKDQKLIGLLDYESEHYPFLKANYIPISQYFYGVGMGDEIYPTYIAKCARFNQVYDLSTFEIKGGGFYDPEMIPEFSGLAPGIWRQVPGLASKLNNGQKGLISWGEIRNVRASSSGMDILPSLNEALQTGSGATSLLAGMPSASDVDKTASGINIAIKESNARINTYLENFEDDLLKSYAVRIYENYQDNLIPDLDLPQILDPQELMYVDDNGQPVKYNLSASLLDIDFTFQVAKRVMEAEEDIGKTLRFLSILQQIGGASPAIGQAMASKVDFVFLIKKIANDIGFVDLDRLFPDVNLGQELIQTKQELQMVGLENEVMKQTIDATMQSFQQQGNQAAIDAVNQNMQMAQEKMQQMMGGGGVGTGQPQ